MDESHFSKLPPELRNVVYEMVLCHDSVFTFNARRIGPDSNGPGLRLDTGQGEVARSCLAITQTCSEIRGEAYVMFFAVNRFFCSETTPSISGWTGSSNARHRTSLHALREWLDVLPRAAAKAIKLTILFGAANGVTTAKATIWRRQARKLESAILHPVMNPANIFAMFSVCHQDLLYGVRIRRSIEAYCHMVELDSCLGLAVDIPTGDLSSASQKVEQTLEALSARIKQNAAAYPCCIGPVVRALQEFLEMIAGTVRQAVGGSMGGKSG